MRSPRVDTVLSLIGLIVAAAAFGLSWVAWQRPLPADPRDIPSFGSGKQAKVVDGGRRGRELFKFLDDNEGRLIRIVAELDGVPVRNDDVNSLEGTALLVPGPDCPEDVVVPESAAEVDTDVCNWLLLEFETRPEEDTGLFWNSGAWYVKGYFANVGYVDTSANLDSYHVEVVSLVDAVT